MSIFTLIFGALGIYALRTPITVATTIMLFSTLFATAAALFLPGGQSILVAHFFLLFFALRVLFKVGPNPLIRALSPGKPGFFLMLFAVYGAISVVLVLPFMQGKIMVYALDMSKGIGEYILKPLAPSGMNFNQTIYMFGNLIAFICAYTVFRLPGMYYTARNVLIYLSMLNIFMAFLDLATWATGTSELLSFMKNANFAFLDKDEIAGFKRISGSFSEASAFAGYTSRLFTVCLSLWVFRIRPKLTGPLALVMLILLIFSTSTTAYVGITASLAIVLVPDFARFFRGGGRSRVEFFLGAALVVAALVGVLLIVAPEVFNPLVSIVDSVLFNKLDSDSGKERGAWNEQAFEIFLDTYGLGAGVGTTRASSSLLALLSNVGVIGTLFYGAFALTCLWGGYSPALVPEERRIVRSSRNAVMVTLLAQLFTAGTVDIGVINCLLFGLSASASAPRLRLSWRRPVAPRFGMVRPATNVAPRYEEGAGPGRLA